MPITPSDIRIHLSGGAGNTNPNASLGGVRSTTLVVDNTLQNLFDNVTGAESSAGDTEYRCVYVENYHGSLTWENVRIFLQSQVPGGGNITIGLDPAGVGNGVSTGVATTVATEQDAPAGVTFSGPTTFEAGLVVGDVDAGEMFAYWIKRVVPPSTPGQANDGVDVAYQGDTPP